MVKKELSQIASRILSSVSVREEMGSHLVKPILTRNTQKNRQFGGAFQLVFWVYQSSAQVILNPTLQALLSVKVARLSSPTPI